MVVQPPSGSTKVSLLRHFHTRSIWSLLYGPEFISSDSPLHLDGCESSSEPDPPENVGLEWTLAKVWFGFFFSYSRFWITPSFIVLKANNVVRLSQIRRYIWKSSSFFRSNLFSSRTGREQWISLPRKAEDSSLESGHQGPRASTAHKQMCPCPQPSTATQVRKQGPNNCEELKAKYWLYLLGNKRAMKLI